jgi:phosphoglucosamine mutase
MKNIFTNSGIRGKVDQGLLNQKDIQTLGHAIGCLLAQEFDDPCNILIAIDTRTSSPWIKKAMIQGLVAFGHDIFDAGIAPTPFVAKAIKDYGMSPESEEDDYDEEEDNEEEKMFTLGIVITASHNPAEYNGIKFLTEFGYLNVEMEEEISSLFHEFTNDPKELKEILATEEHGTVVDFDLTGFYQEVVVDQLDHAPYKDVKVVLDCANGATSFIADRIFKACGMTTIAINNTQNGELINKDSGCNNPELLVKAVKQHEAEWGCAFDGDGDRVIIVNNLGEVFDGDDIMAIISEHPTHQGDPIIVGTVMTNGGMDQHFSSQKRQLIRTPVGERNVIDALIKHQAFLGVETCGHITLMEHAFCSDGIFAALMFFDTLASGKKIKLHPYKKQAQEHTVLPLGSKKIDQKSINAIISKFLIQPGRIIIRPSNTEPILRIMVEHEDKAQAKIIIETVKELCLKEIK